MSIKSILAPFTGNDTDRSVAIEAMRIAKFFGAQIDVIYARGYAPQYARLGTSEISEAAYQNSEHRLREEAQQREIGVREQFLKLQNDIKADGTTNVGAVLDMVDGNESDAIIEWGGAYDLLVVSNPDIGAGGMSRDVAETSLVNTGRPIVMVPSKVLETIGRRIVIGWNKSSEASRTIATAVPFLERAEDVLIVHVKTGVRRGPSAGRLTRYLELHGVNAKLREIEPDSRAVGRQLLDETDQFGADLLVIGAYSRNRLREYKLGGVTRHIFDNASIPVLMAR
ncbi:universal stress protein [Alphaproteobacteria bacterium]|nr:universal stress protein [Alphaproteobacteria bacterium]